MFASVLLPALHPRSSLIRWPPLRLLELPFSVVVLSVSGSEPRGDGRPVPVISLFSLTLCFIFCLAKIRVRDWHPGPPWGASCQKHSCGSVCSPLPGESRARSADKIPSARSSPPGVASETSFIATRQHHYFAIACTLSDVSFLSPGTVGVLEYQHGTLAFLFFPL